MFLVHNRLAYSDHYQIFTEKKDALEYFRKELTRVKSYLDVEHYETIYYDRNDDEKTEEEILEISYQEILKSDICQTIFLEENELIALIDLSEGSSYRH